MCSRDCCLQCRSGRPTAILSRGMFLNRRLSAVLKSKPGDYVIKVDDGGTQLEVLSRGKVVAQVPCQWTQLSAKAQASEVDVDGGKITQIKFGGKNSAVSFNN